jgi:hypothetical protein
VSARAVLFSVVPRAGPKFLGARAKQKIGTLMHI